MKLAEMQTIYEDYEAQMTALSSLYPQIVEKFSFGGSYLGREISALRLGGGTHRLLYLGGVTGASMTTELLLRFARDYADAVKSGRRICGIDISYLFHTRSIVLVPLLNPDGAVLREGRGDALNPLTERLSGLCGGDFSHWETNGRGVDLRCNYDVRFDVCMQNGCGIGERGYPGARPESEPECAAAARFLRGAGTLDLGIQFLDGAAGERHGKIAWSAQGGGSRSGVDYRTRTIAQILSEHSGYPTDETPAAGSLKDWYRQMSAGAFFEITCVRECEELSPAFLALRYGQLQKLLFHSAVL